MTCRASLFFPFWGYVKAGFSFFWRFILSRCTNWPQNIVCVVNNVCKPSKLLIEIRGFIKFKSRFKTSGFKVLCKNFQFSYNIFFFVWPACQRMFPIEFIWRMLTFSRTVAVLPSDPGWMLRLVRKKEEGFEHVILSSVSSAWFATS